MKTLTHTVRDKYFHRKLVETQNRAKRVRRVNQNTTDEGKCCSDLSDRLLFVSVKVLKYELLQVQGKTTTT